MVENVTKLFADKQESASNSNEDSCTMNKIFRALHLGTRADASPRVTEHHATSKEKQEPQENDKTRQNRAQDQDRDQLQAIKYGLVPQDSTIKEDGREEEGTLPRKAAKDRIARRRSNMTKLRPIKGVELSSSIDERSSEDQVRPGARVTKMKGTRKRTGRSSTVIEMEDVSMDSSKSTSMLIEESTIVEPLSKERQEAAKSHPRRRCGLQRSEKILQRSSDLEMPDTSSLEGVRKPIDVVVDIHYENEEKVDRRSRKKVAAPIEDDSKQEESTRCFALTRAGKMFSQRNVALRNDEKEDEEMENAGNSLEKLEKSRRNQGLKRVLNDLEIEDSLDLIEELKEDREFSKPSCSVNERSAKNGSSFEDDTNIDQDLSESKADLESLPESRTPVNNTGRSDTETLIKHTPNSARTSIEIAQHRRKRWTTMEHNSEDTKRPAQRKRWSKGRADLPLVAGIEDSSSGKSTSNVVDIVESPEVPIPAPRIKANSHSFTRSCFENAAFESDHEEEVLRIETDYRQSTRIEMRKRTASEEKGDSKREDFSDRNEISRATRNLSDSTFGPDILTDPVESFEKNFKRVEPIIQNSEESDVSSSMNEDTEVPKTRSRSSIVESKSGSSKRFEKNQDDMVKLVSSLNLSRSEEEEFSEGSSIPVEKSRGSSGKRIEETGRFSNKEKSLYASTHEDSKKVAHRRRRISDLTNEEGNLTEEDIRPKSGWRISRREVIEDEEKVTKKEKKKRKKKKHAKRKVRSSSSSRHEEDLVEEAVQKAEETKYISVTIHRADILETDYITKHPMVKVHIVRASTGDYLKTSTEVNSDRDGKRCGYLQPVITGKFDFRENKSILPIWEEELIFEHDFGAILKTEIDGQVLILFEVIDLLGFSEASLNYSHFGSDGCWYKIAWAFLKPVGANGMMHIRKKVRLQLYRPQRHSKNPGRHKCEVYTWWKSNIREKYPSSLFVTVNSVEPPNLEPVFYEQLNLNDLSDVRSSYDSQKTSTRTADLIELPKWTRLSAQSCKIPNENFFETAISENGCFYVVFSNDGKYLACAVAEEYKYPIAVYTIDEGKIYVEFLGHKSFIYSLNWSNDDRYLLSVSSDQTACLWDVREKTMQSVQLLPHPSYVYCGKFDPEDKFVVATGCYDHVARIWTRSRRSKEYELSQELEGHEGFVNSLCFKRDGSLLTADSVGRIILWTTKKNRKTRSGREWQISRKIKIREVENVVINTIVLHPQSSRLLVHSRNNGLRMLDLETGVVLQRYSGLTNQRIQTAACISPCGGLILCGGENSSLNVWGLESGRLLARYTAGDDAWTIACVDYHPYDHILAYATFGRPSAVKVIKFDKNSNGENVGLSILVKDGSDIRNINDDVVAAISARSGSKSSRRISEDVAGNFGSQGRSFSTDWKNSSRNLESGKTRRGDEERRKDLKLKLQKLNESEQSLKLKSASRLNSIIEKIDKILSNSSSKCDLESTRASGMSGDKKNGVKVFSSRHGNSKNLEKSRPNRSRYSNLKENSMSNTDEAMEAFELKDFSTSKSNDKSGTTEKRAKSAKETRMIARNNIVDEDLSKTYSDGALQFREHRIPSRSKDFDPKYSQKFGGPRSGGSSTSVEKDESVNVVRHYSSKSEYRSSVSAPNNEHRGNIASAKKDNKENSPDTPDSTGTYIVEKSDLERNDDTIVKVVGSDSSIRSDVTFVIENERSRTPIPKPRRKIAK